MFKFEFSANEADRSNRIDDTHDSIDAGDALIQKLQQRSDTSKCTIVNVSAQSLANGAVSTFEPKLGFHRQETVDLLSAVVDPLRCVIPQHTLSDDTTDLIPGVYEGGLKVWECSVDLCRFLAAILEQVGNNSQMDVDGNGNSKDTNRECIDYENIREAVKRAISHEGMTLELGCGHGLPGCLLLRENIRNTLLDNDVPSGERSKVVFVDFNDFVLQHATIPNAQINVSGLRYRDGASMDKCDTANSLLDQAVFVGGDWMGLPNKISNKSDGRFDLILAAETTYTVDSCNDTAFLMGRHLKAEIGVGLVATKRFYFGVGGGTDMLSDAIKTLNSSNLQPLSKLKLVMRTIKSYDTGHANIRDLVEIRLLNK